MAQYMGFKDDNMFQSWVCLFVTLFWGNRFMLRFFFKADVCTRIILGNLVNKIIKIIVGKPIKTMMCSFQVTNFQLCRNLPCLFESLTYIHHHYPPGFNCWLDLRGPVKCQESQQLQYPQIHLRTFWIAIVYLMFTLLYRYILMMYTW